MLVDKCLLLGKAISIDNTVTTSGSGTVVYYIIKPCVHASVVCRYIAYKNKEGQLEEQNKGGKYPFTHCVMLLVYSAVCVQYVYSRLVALDYMCRYKIKKLAVLRSCLKFSCQVSTAYASSLNTKKKLATCGISSILPLFITDKI